MSRKSESGNPREFDQVLRIFARIFAPVLLILIVVTAAYIYLSYLQIREQVYVDEASTAQSLATSLREEFSDAQAALLAFASDTSIDARLNNADASPLELQEALVTLAGQLPSITSLSLIAADGSEIAAVRPVGRIKILVPQLELENIQETQLFQQASQLTAGSIYATDRPAVPEVLTPQSLMNPWLGLATPLASDDGTFAGLLVAEFTSIRLYQQWQELSASVSGYAWVQKSDSQRLALLPLKTDASDESIQQVLNNLPAQGLAQLSAYPASMQDSFDLQGGHFTFARVCLSSICQQGNSAETASLIEMNNLQNDMDWTLVTYISPGQLEIIRLLRAEADRWHPLGTMMIFFMLIAGIVTWIFSIMVTRLRNKEQEIVLINELHEAFFEKNPSIMFVKDLRGRFYLANESCRRLAGDTSQSLTGESRTAVFPAEAAEVMQQQDDQVIASGEAQEFFSKWPREDGVHYYTTLRFPMCHEDGELYAVGGIANEITDQVQARKALKERESLLRTLLESAPEAAIIAESTGVVGLVNKQTEMIFEFSRRELEGKHIKELLPGVNETMINRLMEDSADDSLSVQKQMTGLRTNGRVFPVEVSLSPVRTASGNLIICMVRDMTERTIMEARLRQSQKLEAIGKLTGGMAHDFNNLLGIIMGNIDLAVRKVGDDPVLQKRLETAKSAAERGAELTKRMLAVARRQPLQPEPASVNDIIADVAELLPRTLGPDIEMSIDLQKDLATVLIDRSGLENVLINLAINARDAMPNGGVFTITSKQEKLDHNNFLVRRNLIPEGEFIHMIISDNGTGMSKETLNHAFEPFFSTKEKGKGSGMGLSMSYGFITQSNGYIYLSSELGEGTKIDIYLPAVNQSVPERIAVTVDPEQNNPLYNDKTVLVVDDEAGLLDVAVHYLEDMGFKVLSSLNGKDALQKLSQSPKVDLLITDIVMPGAMNGVALAAEVRRERPGIKVVYVSGFPSGVIEDKSGIKIDAPLLNKPYDRASLASIVVKVLN